MPILNSQNSEAARRANVKGSTKTYSLSHFDDCTLPGVIEFFLSAKTAQTNGQMSIWLGTQSNPKLANVWNKLEEAWGGANCVAPTGKARDDRTLEFFGLNSIELIRSNSLPNLALGEFENRLVGGACRAGLSKDFSYSLASVVHELIENVVQHSDGDARRRFQGISGYHVSTDYIAFTVADLGMGTLQSLRLSNRWNHLHGDRDALRAILTDHASRKPDALGEGEGYKTVLKSLATKGASIRVRSGVAGVRICPSDGDMNFEWFQSPELPGVQVSVVCSVKEVPKEKSIFN